jgi:hypothetical protein
MRLFGDLCRRRLRPLLVRLVANALLQGADLVALASKPTAVTIPDLYPCRRHVR